MNVPDSDRGDFGRRRVVDISIFLGGGGCFVFFLDSMQIW